MKNNYIKIKNLKKVYNKRAVVSDVSIQLNKGEVIGLLGPNGAGKTTTFYMITGMVKVSSGSIFLGDKDITNISMDKRARLGLGYLAQEPSIFGKLSVEDNLNLVLEMRKDLTKSDQKEKMEIAQNRTEEIVANDEYWKSKFKQLDFPIMSSDH